MPNIENIIYEAHYLGIKENVYKTISDLRQKNPYAHLEDLYDKALSIEKNKLNK